MQAVPRYDTDRYTALDQWHSINCGSHVEILDEVARMDRKEEWTFDGASSMANWLVNRYNLSQRTASEWVRVANSIQDLPAIRAAYQAGRMSWDQVRTVTRIATTDTDDELAEMAPDTPVRDLNRLARDIQLRDVEKVHRERSLTWKFDEELPVFHLYGQMPAADGVELVKTITRYANQATPQPGGTYELFAARCVDALLQLASEARGADSDPDRATAVIHIPIEHLSSTGGDAESEEGVPLHIETARRLVCDARLQVSVEDTTGTVVGVGRTTRSIPPWLARVVRNRDRGCRYPGCRRERWIHIHHLIHWAHGGPTDLDNLISLCPYHHRLIHEGGWRISGDPNSKVSWLMPGGREFVPCERYRSAASHPILMLEDFSVPEHLKGPDPPDTS